MIGAVADAAAFDPASAASTLADLRRVPGLYLINGFGARGIVWSALAGELLACLITGAPPARSPTTWSAPSTPAVSCSSPAAAPAHRRPTASRRWPGAGDDCNG
jgi:glycine/D-amino acid oxidase-like deaminating enzyme